MMCPMCKKNYEPVLKRKTGKLIQDEFPTATKEQREQLISGVCSDECWDKMFGDVEIDE